MEGVTVTVEFLCETDEVEPGRIFKPRADARLCLGCIQRTRQAQIRDAGLFVPHNRELSVLREVDCHESTFVSQTSSRTPALKVLAFQDRHENKETPTISCIAF